MTQTRKVVYQGLPLEIVHDPSDQSIQGCIYEIIDYDAYKLHRYKNLEDKVFIDIGANCGLCAIILAKQNPKSVVYAFEPVASSYDRICKNVALNKLTNVHVFKNAVTNTTGDTVEIRVFETASGVSTIHADKEKLVMDCAKNYQNNTVGIELVQTISLADFVQEKGFQEIELLKIDCEGSEYDILYHLPSLQTGGIRNIAGEFHDFKAFEGKEGYTSGALLGHVRNHVPGHVDITTLDLSGRY